MTNRWTRRRYLLALGAVGATGLAGCSESESESSEPGESPPASDDGTATETGTETATGETAMDASGSPEAEATLRRYLEALADGDSETAGSLRHPDLSSGEAPDPVELTINEIASTTLSALADSRSLDMTEGEVADARGAIEAVVADIGAEGYATFRYDIETTEYGAETGTALLVRDDGEWYFYQFGVETYLYEANEPDSTGDSTDDQMTNRLQEVSSIGRDVSGETVGRVDIIVKKAPGANDVDLSATTMQFVHSSGSTDLTFGTTGGGGSATEFGVESIQDEGETSIVGDSPTLDDPADRARVVLDTGAIVSSSGGLSAGGTATVRLTTQSGGTTEVRLVVPESLSGQDVVSL